MTWPNNIAQFDYVIPDILNVRMADILHVKRSSDYVMADILHGMGPSNYVMRDI